MNTQDTRDCGAGAMNAIEMIGAERQRQIAHEGWTENHDDEHKAGEIAMAAAAYAIPQQWAAQGVIPSRNVFWPWESGTYKPNPSDRLRELVKAGALIVAEIERLQRASNQ